jgi:hypothetical protein
MKGVWIFNPGGMAIKRFSTEIGLPVWQLFLLARALRLALCPLHLTPDPQQKLNN